MDAGARIARLRGMNKTSPRSASLPSSRPFGGGRFDRLRDAAMVGAAFGMVLATTLFAHV